MRTLNYMTNTGKDKNILGNLHKRLGFARRKG